MNIKALITTLAIVGSSSVAMARPVTYATPVKTVGVSGSASFSFGTAPTVRDHRTVNRWEPADRWNAPAPQAPQFGRDYREPQFDRMNRFVTLSSDMQFGASEYRKDIMPGTASRFSTLRIEADAGRTYVMKVVVEFADGTAQQQIDLNKTLVQGDVLTLDLTGNSHTINRIMVYRADNYDTSHLEKTHRGEFSVSAK